MLSDVILEMDLEGVIRSSGATWDFDYIHNLVKNVLWANPVERREAALRDLRTYLGLHVEVASVQGGGFTSSLLQLSPEWKYMLVGLYRTDAPVFEVLNPGDPPRWTDEH